jgi:parallel beta-helix repeat protein
MRIPATLLCILIVLAGVRTVGANEHVCPGAGFPFWDTIQQALGFVEPGDSISVCPGAEIYGAHVDVSGISISGGGAVIVGTGFAVFSDDVSISGFEFRDVAPAFLLLGNRASLAGNTIRDSDSGFIAYGSDHRIVSNTLDNIWSTAISLAGVQGGEVAYNTITGATVGIEIGPTDPGEPPTRVHHNGVKGAETGILGVGCAAAVITNNVVSGGTVGIGASACDAATIKNNLVRGSDDGIVVTACARTVVSNNTARDNVQAGVDVSSCTGAVVKSNRVLYNGDGLVVDDCAGCTVGFNAAHFNGLGPAAGHGIVLSHVDGSRVERNYATRNNPADCVWDGAGVNTFSDNLCATESPAGAWD